MIVKVLDFQYASATFELPVGLLHVSGKFFICDIITQEIRFALIYLKNENWPVEKADLAVHECKTKYQAVDGQRTFACLPLGLKSKFRSE